MLSNRFIIMMLNIRGGLLLLSLTILIVDCSLFSQYHVEKVDVKKEHYLLIGWIENQPELQITNHSDQLIKMLRHSLIRRGIESIYFTESLLPSIGTREAAAESNKLSDNKKSNSRVDEMAGPESPLSNDTTLSADKDHGFWALYESIAGEEDLLDKPIPFLKRHLIPNQIKRIAKQIPFEYFMQGSFGYLRPKHLYETDAIDVVLFLYVYDREGKMISSVHFRGKTTDLEDASRLVKVCDELSLQIKSSMEKSKK